MGLKAVTRLDVWLVAQRLFSSRQSAKRAIRSGLVIVNGRVAKPSTQVSGNEHIVVLSPHADRPRGYEKLRCLLNLVGIVPSRQAYAIDIGSSAGGFLKFLGEAGVRVIGIEVSPRFLRELSLVSAAHSSVSVVLADAFRLPTEALRVSVDLLLVDVTTTPSGTIKLIERYAHLVRPDGHVIAAIKARPTPQTVNHFRMGTASSRFCSFRAVVLDTNTQEFHVVVRVSAP